MTPELNIYIDKNMSNDIEKLVSELIDTTNVMGGEKFMSSGVLCALVESNNKNSFFALLRESIPFILEYLSPNDGRVTATHSLLVKLNKLPLYGSCNKQHAKAFANAVLKSHSTLVQSFYRSLRDVAVAYEDNALRESMVSLETDIAPYKSSKARSYAAITSLLKICDQLDVEEDSKNLEILSELAKDNTYLPFV